jgi:uncharacterized protein (DUF111 family)
VSRTADADAKAILGASGDGKSNLELRTSNIDIGEAFIVETNIDDMNPEWFAFVEERLFEAGAADVFRIPIVMKKSRAAVQLSILVPDAHVLVLVQDVLLAHTTTLGLRYYAVKKTAAERRIGVVNTPFGPIHAKWVKRNGRVYGKPEYDDCCKIAVERGLTLHEVYQDIAHSLHEINWTELTEDA